MYVRSPTHSLNKLFFGIETIAGTKLVLIWWCHFAQNLNGTNGFDLGQLSIDSGFEGVP